METKAFDAELAQSTIAEAFEAHAKVLQAAKMMLPQIQRVSSLVTGSLRNGGTILLGGNGGSAADAQHLAGEFVGRFYLERRALPAIALHTNSTIITAIGNDYGYDMVFERQIYAHGRPEDVFIGITTSGNSTNILLAAEAARKIGIPVVGMTGESGGKLKELSDECLCVPSSQTPRIQEMHILIGHVICQIAEAELARD